MRIPLGPAAVSILLLCTNSRRAGAEVETAFYINSQTFGYKITQMTDLDQRRDDASGIPGLPGNGGMYCVPTSTVNMMIYAANHGFPGMAPGPGNYNYNGGLYNYSTQVIAQMGMLMGTTPEDGTNGGQWYNGMKAWLSASYPGLFTITHYTGSGNFGPNLSHITKAAVHGSLVSLAYGKYIVTGSYAGVDLVDRAGGHIVTLGHAYRLGSLFEAGLRDPANPDDGELFDQSPFGTRILKVTERVIATAPNFSSLKLVNALDYDVLKEKNAYIDGYLGLKPKYGLTWLPDLPSKTTTLTSLAAASFLGSGVAPTQSITIEGLVLDAVIGPDQNSILVIVAPKAQGPNELIEVDLVELGTRKIANVPGATSVSTSRNRRVYAAGPNSISKFDLADYVNEAAVVPPFPVGSIAFDDNTDQLILLCPDAKKILRWSEALTGNPTVIALPSSLTMGGDSTLAIHPKTGDMLFATEKSPKLISVANDGAPTPNVTSWDLAGIPFPTALDLDDIGHLFAVADNRVYELAPNSSTGWQSVASPFDSWQVYAGFRVSKSRTNHDPLTMIAPKYRNLDPSELAGLVNGEFVPDCDGAPSNLEYGAGKAGSFGVPSLTALDLPTLGLSSSIELSNGRPGALPVLLIGTQQAALPFDGGTLHLVPQFVYPLPIPIPQNGKLTLTGELPADPTFCGVTLYHQILFVDPSAPGFYHTALTNGLRRTFGS